MEGPARSSTDAGDRRSRAWPFWLLRYMATDDLQALDDLLWSVEGSPYGGISYEEASAVFELVDGFRGPGEASEQRYRRVENLVKDHADRKLAITAFRCFDQITSSSGRFPRDPVDRGLQLAREIGHPGVEAAFLSYQSDWEFRQGNVPGARDSTREALDRYLALVDDEPAYATRIRKSAQNLISYTALSGDVRAAWRLLESLSELLDPTVADQLRRALEARL